MKKIAIGTFLSLSLAVVGCEPPKAKAPEKAPETTTDAPKDGAEMTPEKPAAPEATTETPAAPEAPTTPEEPKESK